MQSIDNQRSTTRAYPHRRALAVVVICLSALLPSTIAETNAPIRPKTLDDALYKEGRYVYQRNCLTCHGVYGDGRGDMGLDIRPQPRNFGRGIFKYRSTPVGMLPTDADLERTIRGGLAGTAMPIFNNLNDHEIKSVVEYIKTFSSRWRNPTNYAPAIVLPPLPTWFNDSTLAKARAEKGMALFNAACAACHGPDGSGVGATVKDLQDTWGQPSTPSDLRQPSLRSGATLETVYRVLLTGIDGAPMPSFATTLTEEQRWDIVAFVDRLRQGVVH